MKNKKRFNRFECNPLAIVKAPAPNMPDLLAIEVNAGGKEWAYTVVPVSVWNDESRLMAFLNNLKTEAGI